MSNLFVTLVADGPSDAVLLHHLKWLLRQHLDPRVTVQGQWADLVSLRERPKNLTERIVRAIELYPCDLLFIHRDAERDPPAARCAEIERAVADANVTTPIVAVVPVRMTEAWLLFDEHAVRCAAGNPNGSVPLRIPVQDAEQLADPKSVLREALRCASGLSGRKLHKFRTSQAVHRVADYIEDFSPLRLLPAFRKLEEDLAAILRKHRRS